jgi:hypothetical protein
VDVRRTLDPPGRIVTHHFEHVVDGGTLEVTAEHPDNMFVRFDTH